MYRTLKITICVSSLIVFLLMSSYAVFLRRMPILTGYDCTNEQVNMTVNFLQSQLIDVESNRTREDYRKIVEDDFNCHFYLYQEKDLPEGIDGTCQPLFRSITIDSDIDNFYYCSAFAHEVIHLTGYIQQENYVTFRTFVYLYEHSDPELHNFGIRVAIHTLVNAYPDEYNCSGEIIEYLFGNNIA